MTFINKLLTVFKKKSTDLDLKEYKPNNTSTITKEELAVCAAIFSILSAAKLDVSLLRFYKDSAGYVSADILYSLVKFKFTSEERYIILSDSAARSGGFPIEKATMTEGGTDYLRAYFNAPSDLFEAKAYIVSKYYECYQSYLDYRPHIDPTKLEKNMKEYFKEGVVLTEDEAARLLQESKGISSIFEKKASAVSNTSIKVSDLNINPKHNRVSLLKVKNLNDWKKGFDAGYPIYMKGEKIRKQGQVKEAIALFDKARYNGYSANALYWSYALAYRKLKDYENEIAILQEGLYREDIGLDDKKRSRYEARQQKAIELLLKNRK
ncbi:hypothetical protein CJ205_07030 [Dolosicoccus paucivorans]|uniref:Tetratricopeptide repeat protein n=1 Tax=Dolosicoccus paucivorans TaxID=84521 RepID=A0A2N6SLI2_9LACT|nr:hypothetical protein [Dolosicoccus paucivorans]PMB83818.1 hypothetical protein CJ206_07220 [Dolosicoccus paucivorans]PMC57947.1 hypothetical protein CJ205_07030 [Dolosicoccus paucivorans]